MNFRVRWQDIVKHPGDSATKDDCTIRQINNDSWHLYVHHPIPGNYLAVRTSEGVDLTLEEYCIKNEEWRKA